ncbi:Sulfite exporter TauE/SafE family protein 2 [Linum grandiflorum]
MSSSSSSSSSSTAVLLFLFISFPVLAALSTNYPPPPPPNDDNHQPTSATTAEVAALLLCFAASSISSAGGIGGGGLFIPILTLVAGYELRTASTLSAFMVSAGSVANVICSFAAGAAGGIDFDIALLSEPMMLLGVSIGVIWNVVFPEWLITAMFVAFLVWSTAKTCRNGVRKWNLETEEADRMINDDTGEPILGWVEDCEGKAVGVGGGDGGGFAWMKLGILVVVWFSFSLIYLFRGNRYGQGIIQIKPCGIGYWAISSFQIPLSIVFTAWILIRSNTHQLTCNNNDNNEEDEEVSVSTKRTAPPSNFIFPVMALLAGILGGLFGIGGGMLISPLLLQVGISAEVTAATCSFMVFFSSSMSALQFLMLGMEHTNDAIVLSATCFVASLLGLVVVHRAIKQYGRASLIVFSVATVMALSTVLMTSFGALQVWRDYQDGNYMGFKPPC